MNTINCNFLLFLSNTSSATLAANAKWLREGIYTPLIARMPGKGTGNGGGKVGLPPFGHEAGRSPNSSTNNTSAHTIGVATYPNPFTSRLTFDLSGLSEAVVYEISVTDMFGKEVWHKRAQGGTLLTWNGKDKPSGTYFYSIHTGKSFVISGKIVKFSN